MRHCFHGILSGVRCLSSTMVGGSKILWLEAGVTAAALKEYMQPHLHVRSPTSGI